MNKVNYQKQLDEILRQLPETEPGKRPGNKTGKKLLLHSCCAPCSSYVLEYLRQYFEITVLYYNPNITEREEYAKRVAEQKRLIREMNEEAASQNKNSEAGELCSGGGADVGAVAGKKKSDDAYSMISLEEGRYDPEIFFAAARGLELVPEGGERCFQCYEIRLRETARIAKEQGFDYFTTTLTISPLKNADKLNEIGNRLAEECGVAFLPSDFKKKNGYKRSVELSEKYGLYRQDYCGCVFSRAERERSKGSGV